jgi:hypothetical protein
MAKISRVVFRHDWPHGHIGHIWPHSATLATFDHIGHKCTRARGLIFWGPNLSSPTFSISGFFLLGFDTGTRHISIYMQHVAPKSTPSNLKVWQVD